MERRQASQITTGLLVIAVGLVLLTSQLNVGWAWNVGRLWPVIFLVLGVSRFLNADRDGRGAGVWFLFLGVIFLLHTYRIWSVGHSWPLFIIAGGVAMLFPRERRRGRRRRDIGASPADTDSNAPGSGEFRP